MNSKFIWIVFAIAFILLVPIKIFLTLFNLAFGSSMVFLTATIAILLGCMLIAGFSKISLRHVEIRKNWLLSAASFIVAGFFCWNIIAYFNDNTQYDWGWQPFAQAFWSVLAFISFLIFAFTFLIGKNFFTEASFMLYCPTIWVCGTMFLLLSIYNTQVDVYDVIVKIMLVLFLFYHTQVFSTSTEGNVTKYTFLFGIPLVIASCMYNVPLLIMHFTKIHTDTPTVMISNSFLELSLALYALVFMWESWKQIKANSLNSKVSTH